MTSDEFCRISLETEKSGILPYNLIKIAHIQGELMTDTNDEKSRRLSLKDVRESGSMSDEDIEILETRLMEIKLQEEVDEWYRKRRRKTTNKWSPHHN